MYFNYKTVLTVTTGRLLCNMKELYEVLNYLTGTDVYTHQLPRVTKECKKHLLEYYPELDICTTELNRLKSLLDDDSFDNDYRWEIVNKWCKEILDKYLKDENYYLIPIPNPNNMDPIEEAIQMKGKENVFVCDFDNHFEC